MFKYYFCLCCNKINVGPEGNNTLLRMLYMTLTSDKANYDEVQKMHICPSCYLRLKLSKLYKQFFSRIRERLDKSDPLISREVVTQLGDTVIGSECPVCFIPKPDAFHIYLHLQASQHCMGCNADVTSLRQHYADRPECMSPINKESRTATIHNCSGLCGASFTRKALLDIHQSQCVKVMKFFAATNPQVFNPMPNNITLVFMPQTQLVPVNYQHTLVYNGGFLNFFEQRQPIMIQQQSNIQVVEEMQAQQEENLVNHTVEKNTFESIETSITSETPVINEILQQSPTEQVHENDLWSQITIPPKFYNKRQVCPLCGGNFFRIHRHMLTHNASHCFKCIYCKKPYKSKSSFDLHQNYKCKLRPNKEKDDATANILCNECGKRFNCIALLKLHKRSHSKISCKICKKVIAKGSYGNHMQLHSDQLHSDQKEVICEFCGEIFRNLILLKGHYYRAHAINKPMFQCDKCEYNTDRKATFQLHLSSHEVGERNQKCDQCDKMFFSQMSLKNHTNNVHMKKQRSVKCPTCGVTLGSAFSLKVHERRHTGIKPYSCDVCGKTFSQRPPLNLHLRTQHNRGSPLVEPCPHCDKRFSSKHLLRTHITKVH